MRIACISDTHNHYVEIEPNVDLIIHAGDAFHAGKSLVQNEMQWFGSVKRQFQRWREIAPVILAYGNHDILGEESSQWMAEEFAQLDIYAASHAPLTFQGIKFWLTSYQKVFFNWAFNLNDEERTRKFAQIEECDFLISHSPCYGILDKAEPYSITEVIDAQGYAHPGDPILLERVKQLKPKYFCAGHLHHATNYGIEKHDETTFIGCCVVDESYKLARKPIYINYE